MPKGAHSYKGMRKALNYGKKSPKAKKKGGKK